MTGGLKFIKYHSYGNDFIIIDLRDSIREITKNEAIYVSDRNFGVGCDGLLTIHKSSKQDDDKSAYFSAKIYNLDGDEIPHSIGGIRCVIAYLSDLTNKQIIKIEIPAGIIAGKLEKDSGLIKINVGIPKINDNKVSIGGEHIVYVVDDFNNIDLVPSDDFHKVYVKIESQKKIFIRCVEQFTGEVFSSSSAICAAAAYTIESGLTEKKLEIETRGSKIMGQTIEIAWEGNGKAMLQGSRFVKSFEGILDI